LGEEEETEAAMGRLLAAGEHARRRRRVAIMLVGASVAASTAAWLPSAVAADRPDVADHSLPPGAVRLPDGRFVRPAGQTYDLGDFSLGLAVSPSGQCAATTDEGWGTAQPVPAVAGVNDAGTNPDEGITSIDLTTGQSSFATPTAPTGLHRMGIGLGYSADGAHLYASGGGTDAVYQFDVGANCALTYVTTVALTPQSPPPQTSTFTGATAAYDRGLAVAPDGAVLVTTEYGRALSVVPVDASGRLTTASVAIAFGTPTVVPHSTNILNFSAGLPNDTAPSYLYDVVAAKHPATGRTRAYVSAEGTKQLLTADANGTGGWVAGPVASVGDHPTGLAVSPDGRTVMVADANSDDVAIVPVNADGGFGPVTTLTLHGLEGEGTGSSPDAVAFDGNDRAYVALAGDNAVAVLDRQGTQWSPSGFVPTGWYPTALAVHPADHSVLAVSAKGLGSRYTPNNPSSPWPVPFAVAEGGSPSLLPRSLTPAAIHPEVQLPALNYNDKGNMPSLLNRFLLDRQTGQPRPENLKDDTRLVADAIAQGDPAQRHKGNPVPDAGNAGDSPIKHVVYIVRENRTFDQVFGDLARTRTDVNADPAYEYLASATPHAHAVVNRFAGSDNFFSDGEASVQGHWWTTSANVTDWIEKAWRLNYSNRNRGQDFLAPVAEPQNCSLFQSALSKQSASAGTFTLRNYGEFYGAVTPDGNGLPVASPCSPFLGPNANTYPGPIYQGSNAIPCAVASAACAQISQLLSVGNFPIYSYSDLSYPNAINGDSGLTFDDRLGAREFLRDVGLNADGSAAAAGPANGRGLASFSYLVLPEDHTTGLSGTYTPRAEVAQNDAAVGQILTALSRSSYWPSTAVFVVEDDSQDGIDHVDGHRNILLVASPFAKQVSQPKKQSGYIGHERYDQASVIRTMELILGLPPLSSYDQNARPLYDLFQDKQAAGLTPADLAPFVAAADPGFINETVASLATTAAVQSLQAQSATMPVGEDVQGPLLEEIDWKATTQKAEPPELAASAARAESRVQPDGDG
jgi:DNA-binding beta-propeller fold protein YncE